MHTQQWAHFGKVMLILAGVATVAQLFFSDFSVFVNIFVGGFGIYCVFVGYHAIRS